MRTKKTKRIDLHNELIIFRFGNGIKLIKPEDVNKYATYHLAYNTGFNIGTLLQLPLSFYFLNPQGFTEKINAEGARLCGYESELAARGKSLFDVATYQSAVTLIKNCQQVITENNIQIFDELNIRKDTAVVPFLSIKAPLYDQQNNTIGTYGCSIVLGEHSLATSLTLARSLGLLNNLSENLYLKKFIVPMNNNISLSRREAECIRLTIKGYTSKRIGQHLGISHRTVEEYMTQLKIKFGAASKSQLIEIAIDYFMQETRG